MRRVAALAATLAVVTASGAAAQDVASPFCVPRAAPIAEGQATLVSDSVAAGTGGRLRTKVLDSPALGTRTRVNVLVPRDYDPSGATRYPVLYLLHGAITDYNDWNVSGGIVPLVDEVTDAHDLQPFIVVMPDAGHYGWYSDWYGTDLGATGTPPAWSRYHIGELIPWIDRTLPTVADRSGRAIAGLSMGGFGAMSYTARHPDLFAAAGSFSGALNPTYGPGYGQAFVTLASLYFNDGRVTQCIWGDAATQEVRWRGNDPTYLAGNIASTSVFVASGGGDESNPQGIAPSPSDLGSPVGIVSTPVEETVHLMSRAFVRALDAAGLPHTDHFYGSGSHEMKYWRAELRRFLPQAAAAWDAPTPAPGAFTYRTIAPRFSVWDWSFETKRAATEFLYLERVAADGLRITGSGRLDVVTAALYAPGERYRVAQDGDVREVVADPEGRLSFMVDLGPAHSGQQRTFDDAARDGWAQAVVTIAPS